MRFDESQLCRITHGEKGSTPPYGSRRRYVHTSTHTHTLAHSNDTFKHSHELTFPDNDFEIAFHIAVGKIRHRDTAVHHKCYSTTACSGKMHWGKVQRASENHIRDN